MMVLVESTCVHREAHQDVDAIIHVLHQPVEERLLRLKQIVHMLFWRSRVTRVLLRHNDPEQPQNTVDSLRDYCGRGVVGAEGTAQPKIATPRYELF